jgi:Flp pilus assembly protein CpaB
MATTAARRRSARLAAPAWLDGRLLLGVALVAISVVGGLVFWGSARETVPVLVAAEDLPAGHVLQASDLSVAQVKVDGRLSSLSVPDSELTSVVGRTLAGSVYAGEMLVRPNLASGPTIGPTEVGMTVPVNAEAVFSGLRPGDAVAVLATRDKDKPTSQTVTLLERAVVYDMAREPGRVAVSRGCDREQQERGLTNVTLIVPRAEAERIAHAVVNWQLTLALLPPPANPSQRSSP